MPHHYNWIWVTIILGSHQMHKICVYLQYHELIISTKDYIWQYTNIWTFPSIKRTNKFVCGYIDGLLFLTTGNWAYHLNNLGQLFLKLQVNRLKCHIYNSIFWAIRNEIFRFLGYTIIYKSNSKKYKAIVNMDTPTSKRQLHKFFWTLNYYSYMLKRSHIRYNL